jgi:hypothetical protein
VNRIQDEPMPEITGRLRDAFQATADIVQPDSVAPFSVLDAGQAARRGRERPGDPGPGHPELDGPGWRPSRRRALAPPRR